MTTTLSRRPETRATPTGVWVGLAGLAAVSVFFLVRPFFGPLPPYGPRPAGTTYAYSFVVVAAFVPYGLAVWAARGGVGVGTAVAGTVFLHGLVLPAALTQSQDLYAYLFYGKMWAVHGASPYVDLPLAFASDPWFPWMRWPDQPSVYGPLWTMLTGGVARLSGGSLGTGFVLAKGLVAALGLAAVAGGIRAARLSGRDPGLVLLLVAWNPVVTVSLPLGGHADVAVLAAWLWAVVADRRGQPGWATAALSAAALVKAYAGVVLIVYLLALARRRLRTAAWTTALAAALGALAYLPFWRGPETLSGVASIAGRASASLAGEVQRLLAAVAGRDPAVWTVRAAGLAVLFAVIVGCARRPRFAAEPWPAASAAFLAYVLVTPWFLYWHQVGLLGLAAVAASPAVRATAFTFSVTSMVTASFGATPWGRAVQAGLRYGPPGIVWWRWRER
jgi:hypothetical protein